VLHTWHSRQGPVGRFSDYDVERSNCITERNFLTWWVASNFAGRNLLRVVSYIRTLKVSKYLSEEVSSIKGHSFVYENSFVEICIIMSTAWHIIWWPFQWTVKQGTKTFRQYPIKTYRAIEEQYILSPTWTVAVYLEFLCTYPKTIDPIRLCCCSGLWHHLDLL
jgi:hypothetical protein